MTYEEIQSLKAKLNKELLVATGVKKDNLWTELIMLEEYEAKRIARGRGYLRTDYNPPV